MEKHKVEKSYHEINEKIRNGGVVVVTAEEMIDIVKEHGPVEAARRIDVVTTGTFAPMCSSGAFINLGQPHPRLKPTSVWLNGVRAYAGLAPGDCYIGAAELSEDDPLNQVHPGEFKYGGGHVIQDLVAGKTLALRAVGYGTDCHPSKEIEEEICLKELQEATLCNPSNSSQNHHCAVNFSNRIIYTGMGPLKPNGANATYCSAGQLSPLMNDPYCETIGIGTRIFLGGAHGVVVGTGTKHNPKAKRNKKGVPIEPGATLFVMGNLKKMQPNWLMGVSLQGYGCSLAVGIGIPIPVLNERIAEFTGISDNEIMTHIVDYGGDYPNGEQNSCGKVSYGELKSGTIRLNEQDVSTVPLSSVVRAREVAETLKKWIGQKGFTLWEPHDLSC